MPILGIIASQISGHLFAPSGAYDSIATVTVGSGGSSSITFSSIPSTYTHLQLRMYAVSAGTYSGSDITRFNGDSGANYASHSLYGGGNTANAGGAASQTSLSTFFTPDATNPAVAVADILDYANTSKYKTVRGLAGSDRNGSGYMIFQSGLWMNTAAITSITISAYAGNWNQYSSFALYGVK